jgi:hypothetical protein
VETKMNYIHVSEPICECILVPDSVQIPQGSTLGFQVTLQNNTSKQGSVFFGTKVRKPNNRLTDFIWGPHSVGLTGNGTVSAHKTHGVSEILPIGRYEYYGYVWRDDTGMMDVCSFEFEVIE